MIVPPRLSLALLVGAAARLFAATVLVAGWLTTATAQGEPPAAADSTEAQGQMALTPDLVERFIASWPDFEALGDSLAESQGVDESVTSPTSAFAWWAKAPQAKAQIDALVAKHGFGSLAEWSAVADSTMFAFSYDATELTDERLAEVIAEIEGDPSIPADQKAPAIAQMREYVAAARAAKPLPGNISAIEPYLDELAAIAGGPPPDPQDPAGGAGETQD